MRRRFLGLTGRSVAWVGFVSLLGSSACSSKATVEATPAETDGGSWQYEVNTYDAGQIPTPFSYTSVPDPWPENTAAACKAWEAPDAGGSHAPVSQASRDCLCDNCIDLIHQCDALPGCREMRQCVQDTGCTDNNSCYLFPAPTATDPAGKGCVKVIDRWGNTSVSTYLLGHLNICITANSCPRN